MEALKVIWSTWKDVNRGTRLRGRRSPLRRRLDPPGPFVILRSHDRATKNCDCTKTKVVIFCRFKIPNVEDFLSN